MGVDSWDRWTIGRHGMKMEKEKLKMPWNENAERESENGKGNLLDVFAVPENENGKRKRSSLKNQT